MSRTACLRAVWLAGSVAVCDGSLFPTSCRVNPIDTILALGRACLPRALARA